MWWFLQVKLSQDDLKVLLRILTENLGEAESLEPIGAKEELSLQLQATIGPPKGLFNVSCIFLRFNIKQKGQNLLFDGK